MKRRKHENFRGFHLKQLKIVLKKIESVSIPNVVRTHQSSSCQSDRESTTLIVSIPFSLYKQKGTAKVNKDRGMKNGCKKPKRKILKSANTTDKSIHKSSKGCSSVRNTDTCVVNNDQDSTETVYQHTIRKHLDINGTHQDINGTHQDINETHPDINGTHLDINMKHQDINGTHLDIIGTHTDINGTRLDIIGTDLDTDESQTGNDMPPVVKTDIRNQKDPRISKRMISRKRMADGEVFLLPSKRKPATVPSTMKLNCNTNNNEVAIPTSCDDHMTAHVMFTDNKHTADLTLSEPIKDNSLAPGEEKQPSKKIINSTSQPCVETQVPNIVLKQKRGRPRKKRRKSLSICNDVPVTMCTKTGDTQIPVSKTHTQRGKFILKHLKRVCIESSESDGCTSEVNLSPSARKGNKPLLRRLLASSEDEETCNRNEKLNALPPTTDAHIILPVYTDPSPLDSHSPIIITPGSVPMETEGTEGVCVQENVDNVLHENVDEVSDIEFEKEKESLKMDDLECVVIQEECIPLDHLMNEEELLLGPWGGIQDTTGEDREESGSGLELFDDLLEDTVAANDVSMTTYCGKLEENAVLKTRDNSNMPQTHSVTMTTPIPVPPLITSKQENSQRKKVKTKQILNKDIATPTNGSISPSSNIELDNTNHTHQHHVTSMSILHEDSLGSLLDVSMNENLLLFNKSIWEESVLTENPLLDCNEDQSFNELTIPVTSKEMNVTRDEGCIFPLLDVKSDQIKTDSIANDNLSCTKPSKRLAPLTKNKDFTGITETPKPSENSSEIHPAKTNACEDKTQSDNLVPQDRIGMRPSEIEIENQELPPTTKGNTTFTFNLESLCDVTNVTVNDLLDSSAIHPPTREISGTGFKPFNLRSVLSSQESGELNTSISPVNTSQESPMLFLRTPPCRDLSPERNVFMVSDNDAVSLFVHETLDDSPTEKDIAVSDDLENENVILHVHDDFKRNQVHQWVAEQQRDPPPPPPPALPTSHPVLPSRSPPPPPPSPSPPPPPPPPPRWSNMRYNVRNSNGSSHSALFSDSQRRVASVSSMRQINQNVLRMSPSHTPFSAIAEYVVCDYNRMKVQRHTHNIVILLKALLHHDYTTAASKYLYIRVEHDIHFSSKTLSSLLFLCSNQNGSDIIPKPPLVAHKIFDDLRRLGGGRVAHDDHINIMYTLANYHLYSELFALYDDTALFGLQITCSHLSLMLQATNGLGHHALRLLNDACFCYPLQDLISYSDELLSKLDRTVLTVFPQAISDWIKQKPDVVKGLTPPTLQLLLSVFVECGQWNTGVQLLECCTKVIPILGRDVLAIVEGVIRHSPSETQHLLSIIKSFSPEQTRQLSREVWNALLESSLNLKLIHTSCWLYRTILSLHLPLAKQINYDLICLLADHNCAASLKGIIDTFLAPPIVPSTLLVQLCHILEKDRFASHLYTVCKMMTEQKLSPPTSSLNWLLHYHISKEKIYPWLAELVKQGSWNKVLFDYEFYEKVLVELRGWGKDGEAISCVYRALRKTLPSPRNEETGQESSSGVSSISVSPLLGPSDSGGGLSFSLEGALQETKTTDTSSSLFSLIKQSGSQGQYGAVAAILSSLDNDQLYSEKILQSCLSALTHNSVKPSTGFEQLVTSLKTVRNGKNEELMSHDLWLIGQLGVALLSWCKQNQTWQDGFLVLHCLHLHGIHYVNVPPPYAIKPPLSSCAVALRAVEVCLKVNQLNGAIVVLDGCQFVQGSNEQEISQRVEMLMALAMECVREGQLHDACNCLEQALLPSVPHPLHSQVSRTVFSVLANILDAKLVKESARLIKKMIEGNVPLGSEICSRTIACLLENDEEKAQSLANKVVETGWYDVSGTSPFCLILPVGITWVEVNILLQKHLLKLPLPSTHDFEIVCPSALRSTVEESLTSEFNPPLTITSRSIRPASCVALLVSSASLNTWFIARSTHPKKKSKVRKKEYQRVLCKFVVDEMKPFYQAKRFKSEEDYTHLINLVYNHHVKDKGSDSGWVITKKIETDIKDSIRKIMDTCTIYSRAVDLSHIFSQ